MDDTQSPAIEPASDSDAETDTRSIYFNGFSITLSLSDMHMTIMVDEKPLGKLHMSYITAKTLAANLSVGIKEFEEQTGQSIMIMGDIRDRLYEGNTDE